jgi:hypothetical protein
LKEKLKPIEKRGLIVYAILIAFILLCSIFFSVTIKVYEVSDWNNIIFFKTFFFTIPASILITLFFTSLLVIPKNEKILMLKRRKGLVIGFLFATIINFILLLALVHIGAKFYNIYGPHQQEVFVEGEITNVFIKTKQKRKTNKKYYLTIFSKNLQREIKFEIRKNTVDSGIFKDTLILGSLGFLYKTN